MATLIAGTVLCIVLIRGIIYIVKAIRTNETNHGIHEDIDKKLWAIYLACFFSGVLFANAVPHFIHGVSGEFFPAPFAHYLGNGFLEYLSNIIWGFINIVCGYNLFVVGKVSSTDKWGKFSFFTGLLSMSIFLSFVFSHFQQ
jgi:hypothetical protein